MAASALLVILGMVALAGATPYPRDGPVLAARGCDSPCGAHGQFCCDAGQACVTLAGSVASCVAPGASYALFTTTWTETHTYTSTFMTHWLPVPAPTAGVDCVPPSAEQQACGPICCAGWQTCAFSGQCSVRPGYAEPSAVVVTSDGRVTTRYSAPFRVTGVTTVTSTAGLTAAPSSPAAATPTRDGEAIGADAGSDAGRLSPGAIAGIVLGTLAAVALLLLLCFCCIARGLWSSLCGRPRRRRPGRDRVDVYDERYVRRGSRVPSAYAPRDRHSGWFGRRPPSSAPPSAAPRREKRSDGKWWLGLAGAAATLLALLNLKKDKRPPPRKANTSHYTGSYYTYSDATASPSSSSSGRRTTYTRRTGDTRAGRSHQSRLSGRP